MTRGAWTSDKKVIFYKELHVYFLIISRAIVSLRGYSSIGLLTNMRRGWLTFFCKVFEDAPSSKK